MLRVERVRNEPVLQVIRRYTFVDMFFKIVYYITSIISLLNIRYSLSSIARRKFNVFFVERALCDISGFLFQSA